MASGLKLRNALFWMAPRIVVESRRYGNDVRTLENVEVGASFVADIGTVFKPRYYLVTAGHVVEHAEAGAILFLRSWEDKIAAGEPRLHEYRRHRFAELWYYARDPKLDIAITPLSYGELGEATDHISIGVVPLTPGYNKYLQARARELHSFEEVLFVGYPEGLWDPSSGFAIVRRGVTATSLIDDYRGEPVFLIDGAVYPGCSGGPVVILEKELVVTAEGTLFGQRTPQHVTEQDRFAFLGMITDVVRDPRTREPRLNLGVVVKARHVFAVIREYETLIGHSA